MPYNFTVTFPCKPYVRVFIEQNYGKPVRFAKDKGLMVIIRLLLQRKQTNRWPINLNVYTDNVSFTINEYDYNHFGGELNECAVIELNNYFENKVKTMMRTWCKTMHDYGKPAKECVLMFQSKFGYPEHIWKFESIYKDCQRNDVFDKDFDKVMTEKIHKIFLRQMSRNRTITQRAIQVYEEN